MPAIFTGSTQNRSGIRWEEIIKFFPIIIINTTEFFSSFFTLNSVKIKQNAILILLPRLRIIDNRVLLRTLVIRYQSDSTDWLNILTRTHIHTQRRTHTHIHTHTNIYTYINAHTHARQKWVLWTQIKDVTIFLFTFFWGLGFEKTTLHVNGKREKIQKYRRASSNLN